MLWGSKIQSNKKERWSLVVKPSIALVGLNVENFRPLFLDFLLCSIVQFGVTTLPRHYAHLSSDIFPPISETKKESISRSINSLIRQRMRLHRFPVALSIFYGRFWPGFPSFLFILSDRHSISPSRGKDEKNRKAQ